MGSQEKTGKYSYSNEKSIKDHHQILVFIQALLSLSYFGGASFLLKLIWGIQTIIWMSSCLQMRALNRENSALCLYINGLLEYQHKLSAFRSPSALTTIQILNLFYAYGFYVTCFGLPLICVYAFHWSNPCKFALAGCWILPECHKMFSTSPYIGSFSKLLLVLANHWVWSFGSIASLLAVSGVQILCTMTLHSSLEL